MTDDDTYIGKQIGNYRIVAEIGSGASSRVYRGEHTILTERTVAIKLLHTALGSKIERDRFLQEARLLEKLKHPHILPIYDVGIDNGFPYLVIEYALGGSLRERLIQQASQPLPLEEVVTILEEVGEALQYAHHQNIVHRDLKPGNILFNAKGEALLADFGIATTLATESTSSTPIMGTPLYMAPELFQGMVSKASDQYALGCIAYELFTGHRPFAASGSIGIFEWMSKHQTENPIPLTRWNPALPTYIEQAILKAMAKERKDRHADISAFITALDVSEVPTNMFPETKELKPVVPSETLPPARTSVLDKCPYCGAETRPGDNFCLNCGNRLLSASPSYQQAQPVIGDATIPSSSGSGWNDASDRTVASTVTDSAMAHAGIAADEFVEHPAKLIIYDESRKILQQYILDKPETLIGCVSACDIRFSQSKLVSRLHAIVRYQDDRYLLVDEHSADGTYVNGQRLANSVPYTLKDGDHIGIGEHELIFRTSFAEPIDQGTIGERFMPTFVSPSDATSAQPAYPPEEQAIAGNTGLLTADVTSLQLPSSPSSTFALDQAIAQLLEEGEIHYKAKQYKEALTVYNRAIQIDPRNARTHGYKGNTLGKLKRYKEALSAYEAALTIDPNHASIWNAKGDILSKLRRYAEALVAYERALTFNSDDVRTWTAKGNALTKLRRHQDALDTYDHALTLNPHDAAGWAAKGNVLYKLEHYEDALDAYERALALTPKKAFIWDAKGEAFYKLGRYEDALEAHNRALALDPYNPALASKCDKLRDFIKRFNNKVSLTQVKEPGVETQETAPLKKTLTGAQPVRQQPLPVLGDASTHVETEKSQKQPDDGTRVLEYFHVFLSYSPLDALWVEKNLAVRLEDEHGFRVWMDKWVLVPGEPWQPALARGIDQALCCAVCIGDQASSGWFRQAIQRAKNRQGHDPSFRVIPVLLPNAKEVNIDDFLELNTLVDFRETDFAEAFHVLVCGVKGVPPGRPVSEQPMSTRSSTLAEDMLRELERLRQSNLITDPVKEEYMRLTMQKVWFAEWTLKLKDDSNG